VTTCKETAQKLKQIQKQMDQSLLENKARYLVPDPELGWNILANSHHHSLPYHSNAQGFRQVAFAPHSPTGVGLAFFGDSLVHGDEVDDETSWISQLQKRLLHYSLWNGGVPGYGTDQALMRLEASPLKNLKIDWLFLGVALCDETRNINILRLHRSPNTALPFMKPRFIETPQEKEGGGLQKVTPPYGEWTHLEALYLEEATHAFLKKYDFYYPKTPWFWYHTLDKINHLFKKSSFPLWLGKNPFKLARHLTLKILKRFLEFAERSSYQASILLIPTEYELHCPSALDEYVEVLSSWNCSFFDLRKALEPHDFRPYPREALWCPQGHFASQTSLWIAEYLAQEILTASKDS
jgi:hypothetical protein